MHSCYMGRCEGTQTLSHIWRLDLSSWLLDKHHPPTHTHTSAPGSWHMFQKLLYETLTTLISYWIGIIIFPTSHMRKLKFFLSSQTAAHQTSLSFTVSQSLLKLMSIESVMPSYHFVFCHPLLLLPSVFRNIRVFSNDLALCIRWPKYWSFSISPSSEYTGLISFRLDWFDLLVVQGTLKSLLQHHSSKATILWHSEVNVF